MTSFSGQWIGTYEGSNTGTFVVELDDVGEFYEGTAIAWEHDGGAFGSLVKIRAPRNKNAIKLDGLDVIIVSKNGEAASAKTLADLREKNGIVYPAKVNVEIILKPTSIEATWVSSIGTGGKGNATAQRTEAKKQSLLRPKRLRTWDGFKVAVNKFEPKRFVYRGQESNTWRLRTSFHRTGRSSLDRYTLEDVPELHKAFSSISTHIFDLDRPVQYAALLNLAQHHGYPTPLLDWSWSPYIAAYFAFRRAVQGANSNKNVRVFKFDLANWNKLPRAVKIFPVMPNVTVLNALAFGNPRSTPQQAISTFSNVDDIETHIQKVGDIRGHRYLEAFDLPLSERTNVMRELDLMGINAGSLFPGFDGACEALRERNF